MFEHLQGLGVGEDIALIVYMNNSHQLFSLPLRGAGHGIDARA
jgi:hypothetical protein